MFTIDSWKASIVSLYVVHRSWVLVTLVIIILGYLVDFVDRERFKRRRIKWRKFPDLVFHVLLMFALGLIASLLKDGTFETLITDYLTYVWLIVFIITAYWGKTLIEYFKTKRKITRFYFRVIYLFILLLIPSEIASHNIDGLNLINTCLVLLIVFYNAFASEAIAEPEVSDEASDETVSSRTQLFPTRQRELDRIMGYLAQLQYNEPFAIAINAAWGEGKTSLVRTLLLELEKRHNKVLFIKPTIWDTRDKLVEHFFRQFETLLRTNGIFTGNGSPFQEYVDLIGKLTNREIISSLTGFFGVFSKETADFREAKANLERDLSCLPKRLFIVVDDFDRVEDTTMYDTLMFIKEVADFKRCGVLFLMDFEKILDNDRVNQQYLDKFIGKRFDLAKISFSEIVNYYVHNVNHLKGESDYHLSIVRDEVAKLKNNIVGYLEEIILKAKQHEDHIKKLVATDGTSYENNDLVAFQTKLEMFQEKITNPRKIKRLLRDVRESFEYLDRENKARMSSILEHNLSVIELHRIVFNVAVIKNCLEDDYEILLSKGMDAYLQESKPSIAKVILRDLTLLTLVEIELVKNSIKREVYNDLIFNRPEDDALLEEIKTETDRALVELDSSTVPLPIRGNNVEQFSRYFSAIRKELWKVPRHLTEKRIHKVLDTVFEMYDAGKIALVDVLRMVEKGNFGYELYSMDRHFWNESLKRLSSETGLTFNNAAEKRGIIHNIQQVESHLVLIFSDDFINRLWLYFFNKPQYTRQSLGQALENISSLRELNEAVKRLIAEDFPEDLTNDIDKFRWWSNRRIGSTDLKITSATEYLDKRIALFTDIYESQSQILQILHGTKDTSWLEHGPITNSTNEALDSILLLQEHLSAHTPTVDEYEYFHEYVSRLQTVTSQIVALLVKVYNTLCQYWKPDTYPEAKWILCGLLVAKLEDSTGI